MNVMFLKSLSTIRKQTLILNNLVLYNLNCNKKKMSTLDNVIDGWNDVKNRIKVVIDKQTQVLINF